MRGLYILCSVEYSVFFFFQAEDGIRDLTVTGVQTCALPILHSATKYMNGHSDHLAGVLAGSRARLEPLRLLSHKLGASLDAQVAYDLLRGLRTFALRMERHCATALRVARWLSEHRAVQRVWYPGLPSHPDHELAKRQMSGFGGMVTFTLGTKERAVAFWDRPRLVARAASLGGTRTPPPLPLLFTPPGDSAPG